MKKNNKIELMDSTYQELAECLLTASAALYEHCTQNVGGDGVINMIAHFKDDKALKVTIEPYRIKHD